MLKDLYVVGKKLLCYPTIASIAGVFAGCLGFSVVLLLAGCSPLAVWGEVLRGAWGTKQAASESIVTTIPILLCGLAAALPARAGLINIGGEGQLVAGAIGATGAVLMFAILPHLPLLFLMAVNAVICGGLWGLIPGLLKAMTSASEAVVSLFMNFVALLLMLYLINGHWRDPDSRGWAQTVAFPETAVLPHLPGTRIHLLVLAGLLLAALLWLFLRWTATGMALRLIESAPEAAAYAGVRATPLLTLVMVAGGAIAGLAGFGEVSVIHGRLREGVSAGFGYTGFLVAWLCGHNLLFIPLGAIFLGGLIAGADVLRVASGLPFATVEILQGLILIGVICLQCVSRQLRGQGGEQASTGLIHL